MQMTYIQEVLPGGNPPGRTSSREDFLPEGKNPPRPTKTHQKLDSSLSKMSEKSFQYIPSKAGPPDTAKPLLNFNPGASQHGLSGPELSRSLEGSQAQKKKQKFRKSEILEIVK